MIVQLSALKNQAEGLHHGSRGQRPRFLGHKSCMPCKGFPKLIRGKGSRINPISNLKSFDFYRPSLRAFALETASLLREAYVSISLPRRSPVCGTKAGGKKEPFNPIQPISARLDQIEPQLRKINFYDHPKTIFPFAPPILKSPISNFKFCVLHGSWLWTLVPLCRVRLCFSTLLSRPRRVSVEAPSSCCEVLRAISVKKIIFSMNHLYGTETAQGPLLRLIDSLYDKCYYRCWS
jgi:hypothetical protein